MLTMVAYSHRPQSGHLTCYLDRTYHLLPTMTVISSCDKPDVTCILRNSALNQQFTFKEGHFSDFEGQRVTHHCVRYDGYFVLSVSINASSSPPTPPTRTSSERICALQASGECLLQSRHPAVLWIVSIFGFVVRSPSFGCLLATCGESPPKSALPKVC